ncbi:MAG: hypothetical protein Q9174_005272 [Haloplaca sp. 1 TL-2023]
MSREMPLEGSSSGNDLALGLQQLLTRSRLYEDQVLTDFTIMCSSHNIKCHKVALYPQSRFFKAMLDGTYKETGSSTCDLTKENPQHVAFMVNFLYFQRYDAKPPPPELSSTLLQPPNTNKAVLNFDLYVLGDKFGIDSLVDHASRLFIHEIRSLTGNPLSTKLTDVHLNLPAAPAAFALILDLVPQIFAIGASQNHPLRSFVVEFLVDHTKKCLLAPNKKAINRLMDTCEAFREEYWPALARRWAERSVEETPTMGRSEASASRGDEEEEREAEEEA